MALKAIPKGAFRGLVPLTDDDEGLGDDDEGLGASLKGQNGARETVSLSPARAPDLFVPQKRG